jgi:hypothetical protein
MAAATREVMPWPLVVETEPARRRVHVLVAASREADGDEGVGSELAAQPQRAGEGVRGLDRRDDALRLRQQAQRLHRLGIGRRDVLGAADVGEPGVLGTDAGIVESGRDRVRLDRLAVLVLQDERLGPVEDAGRPRSMDAACLGVSTPSPAASTP